MANTKAKVIGPRTHLSFPKLGVFDVPAKVDTGADSSSVWATNIKERNGVLSFSLFGEGSPFYTGEAIKTRNYQIRSIKNSFGNSELRYKVSLKVDIEGLVLNVSFSLADRSENQFPVLIGRKTLHGRFVVDVSHRRGNKQYKVLVLDVKDIDSVKKFLRKVEKNTKNLKITHATFSDLVFIIADDTATVKLKDGRPLDEFDFVFFKSVVESRDSALALAHYLDKRGIDFADRAIVHFPLTNKLAQYVLLRDLNIRIPKTVYMDWRQPKTYDKAVKLAGTPFIFKDIRESKGRNNFLIKSQTEFKKALSANPKADFIAQQFLPNDGDYRISLFGKRIELVIHRQSRTGSHLNNVSAGGSATLVPEDQLPGEVRRDAIKALAALKLDIGGVDMLQDKDTGLWYCLEVQHGPQITSGSFVKEKREAFSQYLSRKLEGV